jgi:TetR/AcrR family transcriptional regulator, transcriptional repressor for nem operon
LELKPHRGRAVAHLVLRWCSFILAPGAVARLRRSDYDVYHIYRIERCPSPAARPPNPAKESSTPRPARCGGSRERIVDAASRALRRSGVRGVSVAEIMKEAGLTHGGFYAHFPSRDALVAEALAHAGATSSEAIGAYMAQLTKGAGTSPFRAFVESYLAAAHVQDRENGCPVPSVCQEASRQVPEVGDAARAVIRSLHKRVVQVLPKTVPRHKRVVQVLPKTVPRGAAWTIASTLVGAVQLSRAMGETAEGRAVLASARAELLSRYDT